MSLSSLSLKFRIKYTYLYHSFYLHIYISLYIEREIYIYTFTSIYLSICMNMYDLSLFFQRKTIHSLFVLDFCLPKGISKRD